MDVVWNPWHGCTKYSEGCAHCYVYRRDESVGRDATRVCRTSSFDAPVKKNRAGEYKIPSGTRVYACMTSDFFLDRADGWRDEAWDIIRSRPDLRFTIITKRIDRVADCLLPDFPEGYGHVTLFATVENQRRADERVPVLAALPFAGKGIICEPMLGPIDFRGNLAGIGTVICGGESGPEARPLDYAWVLDLRRQCAEAGVRFTFKQTGANFIRDGRRYSIPRKFQHSQAKAADIDWPGEGGAS